MKLEKFVVASVECKESDGQSFSFGDWGMKHPHKFKEYFYTITSTDNVIYKQLVYRKKQKIKEGDTIMCFYEDYLGSGEKRIKYDRKYLPQKYFCQIDFDKLIDQRIERCLENIKFEEEEIARLEKLK